MPRYTRELNELAKLFGLQTSYVDVNKRRQTADPESLIAAIRALGTPISSINEVPAALEARRREIAERGIEPVHVAWEGAVPPIKLRLHRRDAGGRALVHIFLEGGDERRIEVDLGRLEELHPGDHIGEESEYTVRRLEMPRDLPHGYHRLKIDAPGHEYEGVIISAPQKAFVPKDPGLARTWGGFLPLYALRTETSWASASYTDLGDLMRWIGEQGGGVVATLPLLAGYLGQPYDPSPYSPASRMFWNEFYVDVTRVPELEQCEDARRLLNSSEVQSQIAEMRAGTQVDYRGQMALKRRILELLAKTLVEVHSSRYDAFNEFLRSTPLIEDYAAFRAVYERQQNWWREWPERLRDGVLMPDDYDAGVKLYHQYAQWIATQQMQELSEHAGAAGVGLYLDLPLGVRADGFDVWRHRGTFVADASAGAPPDAIFTKGQNWGFAPLHPTNIREQHYRHYRDFIQHHLKYARLLRIDHAMGLHRLWWIPPGMAADKGVYVSYNADEFYSILTLESHRHQAVIVGENLGTVPSYINKALNSHQVRQMYVVQYEFKPDRDEVLGPVPKGAVASVNTHDMPTFAAWWNGEDADDRHDLGLITAEEAAAEKRQREELKHKLIRWLRARGWLGENEDQIEPVLRGCLHCLAASPAQVVLVNLEDLWLETKPQNVPGTHLERPNWLRKARPSFEEFRHLPAVKEVFEMIRKIQSQPVRSRPARRKKAQLQSGPAEPLAPHDKAG